MELLDYSLLTLEELKLYLGIDSLNTDDDEYLKLLINNSTEILNSAVGYIISEQEYTGEEGGQPRHIQRGDDYKAITLPFRNITDTTEFKIEKSNIINDGVWEEVDAEKYWVRKSEGVVECNYEFNSWYNYRFTFSAGFNPIPYDIKLVCMQMIAEIYNTQGTEGIKSEKIDTYSISYGDNQSSEKIKSIVNKYGL